MNPTMWSADTIWHRLRGTHHDYMEADGRIYADYLQPQGRTILDVGTGNGNSAKRFLEAGALKVLCIEKDAGLAAQIRLPRTEVYQEPFDAEKRLLGLEWDACKIDIEGYEILALPLLDHIHRPIIAEVHGAYLIERFQARGFEFVTQPKRAPSRMDVCLMGRKS